MIKLSLKCFLTALVLSSVLILLSGCESPQEKSGYSRQPINKPSDWEQKKIIN